MDGEAGARLYLTYVDPMPAFATRWALCGFNTVLLLEPGVLETTWAGAGPL